MTEIGRRFETNRLLLRSLAEYLDTFGYFGQVVSNPDNNVGEVFLGSRSHVREGNQAGARVWMDKRGECPERFAPP